MFCTFIISIDSSGKIEKQQQQKQLKNATGLLHFTQMMKITAPIYEKFLKSSKAVSK